MNKPEKNRSLRIDKWLWHARFLKSRAASSKFCQTSQVRVNGVLVSKAHYLVRPNDILTFYKANLIRVIKIVSLGKRRGPAIEARALFEDVEEPIKLTKHQYKYDVDTAKRDPGSGRPTKMDRRAIDRLRRKDW